MIEPAVFFRETGEKSETIQVGDTWYDVKKESCGSRSGRSSRASP
jgi:hypothetical protein